jgi:hypothetical protein
MPCSKTEMPSISRRQAMPRIPHVDPNSLSDPEILGYLELAARGPRDRRVRPFERTIPP